MDQNGLIAKAYKEFGKVVEVTKEEAEQFAGQESEEKRVCSHGKTGDCA